MNQKFIIKLEKGIYEQTYKLAEMDLTGGINDVFKILDDAFMAEAGVRFNQMRMDFMNAYQRFETL